MAEPTPAPVGITTRSMPSFRASRPACSGAPPPNATNVWRPITLPRSMAWTRAAFAMFSSTISTTPTAGQWASRPRPSPTSRASAAAARSGWSAIRPPANRSGSSLPSTRLASVTVARSPPRP